MHSISIFQEDTNPIFSVNDALNKYLSRRYVLKVWQLGFSLEAFEKAWRATPCQGCRHHWIKSVWVSLVPSEITWGFLPWTCVPRLSRYALNEVGSRGRPDTASLQQEWQKWGVSTFRPLCTTVTKNATIGAWTVSRFKLRPLSTSSHQECLNEECWHADPIPPSVTKNACIGRGFRPTRVHVPLEFSQCGFSLEAFEKVWRATPCQGCRHHWNWTDPRGVSPRDYVDCQGILTDPRGVSPRDNVDPSMYLNWPEGRKPEGQCGPVNVS